MISSCTSNEQYRNQNDVVVYNQNFGHSDSVQNYLQGSAALNENVF